MKRVGRGAWLLAGAVFGAMVLPMAAFASGSADQRCDEFMSDLHDGHFEAATAHLDSAVKAGLSLQQLGAFRQRQTAAEANSRVAKLPGEVRCRWRDYARPPR